MWRSTKDGVSDSLFISIHKTAGVSFYLKKNWSVFRKFSALAEIHESDLMFQSMFWSGTLY